MTKDQDVNRQNQEKLSASARLVAAGIFAVVVAGFSVLWLSANQHINLTRWVGLCGFKQRYNLPCPGCGWTHAAEMFVTGRFIQAFRTQPAAAFFCVVLSLAAVFALHCAVFGINSRFLQRIFKPKSVGILLAVACIIILAGWIVNLIRTILEN